METFLIIDGNNLLFQMFFGMPARIFNKSGKGIWGTLGFVGATLKLIKKFNPTYTVILFDGETTNERKSLDENYKDLVAEMRQKILAHRDEWEEQSHPWGKDFWSRF